MMQKPSPSDHGPVLYTSNIAQAARQNPFFRTAFWTGPHLQMTLMTIPVRSEIGLEVHPDTDQYLRVEEGRALLTSGKDKDKPDSRRFLNRGDAVFVPAGTWHNLSNAGGVPLRLSSIYAPPHHPRGTVHKTRADAED